MKKGRNYTKEGETNAQNLIHKKK